MNSEFHVLEQSLKTVSMRKADVLLTNQPEDLLKKLAQSKDSKVRKRVALFGNSKAVNAELLQDSVDSVRRSAKFRKRFVGFRPQDSGSIFLTFSALFRS